MRCVVTGASGFIGSTLCEELLRLGYDVVGVDNFTDFYPEAIKRANISASMRRPNFRLVEVDLAAADLRPLITENDVVFHLAAQPGVRSSWGKDFSLYTERGILATQRLLEACRAAHPIRLIHASSSSVYGDATELPVREDAQLRPVSPYGVSKLAAEHLCDAYERNFGLPVVQLRYFTVYGPRQRPDMAFHRFIKSVMQGTPIHVFGDGQQSRDFTYVDDAVAATIAAMLSPIATGFYNVGGGANWSVSSVLETIGRLLGKPIDIRYDPVVPGDVRDTGADTTRARSDLEFNPKTGVEEGLMKEIEWLASASHLLPEVAS